MLKTIIHLIGAARPNFMKIAPVYHALSSADWCNPEIIHTGQHYDINMSATFFQDLGLPGPDLNLEVGSGSHAAQTAGVMVAYEQVCLERRPDWIIVVGDVNSTLACALVGAKLCIPVAHLEAGLRSRDRTMPEEINRLVTDAIADLLWTPSPDADGNLRAEGVPEDKIDLVGNIMIDSYELLRDKIKRAGTRKKLALEKAQYGVVTLHRPSNVDSRATLTLLVEQLQRVARKIPLVFAVHPRTRSRLAEFRLMDVIAKAPGLSVIEPLSYIPFMSLVQESKLVITDSGGIQEETTYLNIPCLTLRDTTERPITISQGTNKLVKPGALYDAVDAVLRKDWGSGRCPELWDGQTASRIVNSLKKRLHLE